LTHVANYFESKKKGLIVGISSVAGDRAKQSNYVYGASKGALSLYLQGLRNRLFPAGVRVLTVKPGFVDTGMTYGMPGLPGLVSPETAARAIFKAIEGRKDIVYVPGFWRWIMLVLKLIPERIFKRLKL
jgi:short-subunit dehydrogenase